MTKSDKVKTFIEAVFIANTDFDEPHYEIRFRNNSENSPHMCVTICKVNTNHLPCKMNMDDVGELMDILLHIQKIATSFHITEVFNFKTYGSGIHRFDRLDLIVEMA